MCVVCVCVCSMSVYVCVKYVCVVCLSVKIYNFISNTYLNFFLIVKGGKKNPLIDTQINC